jgi:hypothetical protein
MTFFIIFMSSMITNSQHSHHKHYHYKDIKIVLRENPGTWGYRGRLHVAEILLAVATPNIDEVTKEQN